MVRFVWRGLRRAVAAPKLLALLWLANVAFALPFALVVTDALVDDIGASRVALSMRQGFDTEWLPELEVRARGLATLFTPLRTGVGVVYENLDAWLSGDLAHGHASLLALGFLYGVFWLFLQGGILARLATPDERFGVGRFFGAAGRYFGRFAQLGGIGLLVYYGLYRLAGRAFEALDEAFRDRGTESELLVRALLLGAVFVGLLHAVRMVLDYAKIAIVLDDERWGPMALWRAGRFVLAHPLRTGGVYLVMGLISLAVLWLYSRFAPGVRDATIVATVIAFLGSQLFVVARLVLRVATLDAEMNVRRATDAHERDSR